NPRSGVSPWLPLWTPYSSLTTAKDGGAGNDRRSHTPEQPAMMPKRWNAAAGVGNQEPKRGSPDFPALDARIDALEETVARYEAIFASLAEALILITPSGEIQSMNKAALSLHQFSSLEEARLHLESGMEQHGAAGPGGHPLTPADWP